MNDLTGGEIARALSSINDHMVRLEEKMDGITKSQGEHATLLATLTERSNSDRQRYHDLRDSLNKTIGIIQVRVGDQEDDLANLKNQISMAKGAAIAGGATGSAGLLSSIVQFFQNGH